MSTNNSSNNPQPQQQINWVPVVPGQGQWFTINVPSGGFSIVTSAPGPTAAVNKKNKDGCDCKKCREYFPYAEPNQDDGTLVCYKCRIGW